MVCAEASGGLTITACAAVVPASVLLSTCFTCSHAQCASASLALSDCHPRKNQSLSTLSLYTVDAAELRKTDTQHLPVIRSYRYLHCRNSRMNGGFCLRPLWRDAAHHVWVDFNHAGLHITKIPNVLPFQETQLLGCA